MKTNGKYYMECRICGSIIPDLHIWFKDGQCCNACGSEFVDIKYNKLELKNQPEHGMWKYFDVLPILNPFNIITCREGLVQIDRWKSLEKYALKTKGINIKVYAHRMDNNPATGTFKDLAGSMIASVLKEHNNRKFSKIQKYAVSSTGNIGVAYARYLADASITLHVFMPNNKEHAQEILCFGQIPHCLDQSYSDIKAELNVAYFQNETDILISPTYDPLRIEAKKTIAYEWQYYGIYPTVYIQAVSGGTGPLGIFKGYKELKKMGSKENIPRMILVQAGKCKPMYDAWESAKRDNFPRGWSTRGFKSASQTSIGTLNTQHPALYSQLAPKVKDSGGEFTFCYEHKVPEIAAFISYMEQVRMGPAAAVAVGGFFRSLRNDKLKDGDKVMIMIGEGVRRSPQFASEVSEVIKKGIEGIDLKEYKREMVRERMEELNLS